LSEKRRRVLPLFLAVVIFAAGAAAYVASLEPPAPSLRPGSEAPAFSLPVPGAAEVSLQALRGRVVFVNFWATWCAPCREEAPSLERLYRALKPEGFEVLGISIDSEQDAAAIDAFAAEYRLTFPLPRDPEKRVYDAYQASGVPETFLVDRHGKVLERFVGPQNWDDPRYARAIRRALVAGERAGKDGGNGGS
jgi:cytochrome c biogenesis protein CcmG/thiol:disulfide interchange protein DsbE